MILANCSHTHLLTVKAFQMAKCCPCITVLACSHLLSLSELSHSRCGSQLFVRGGAAIQIKSNLLVCAETPMECFLKIVQRGQPECAHHFYVCVCMCVLMEGMLSVSPLAKWYQRCDACKTPWNAHTHTNKHFKEEERRWWQEVKVCLQSLCISSLNHWVL